MVTLYYLRRFLNFFKDVFANTNEENFEVSNELLAFYNSVFNTFKNHKDLLNSSFTDKQRKEVLDGLGKAGSNFREGVYAKAYAKGKVRDIKNGVLDEKEEFSPCLFIAYLTSLEALFFSSNSIPITK